MLHLFSCCTVFMLYTFCVALFPCYNIFILNSLFPCCNFYMLYSFHVVPFSELHFFRVALFWYWTSFRDATCCIVIFFVLFHAAPCYIVAVLLSCTIFMFYFFISQCFHHKLCSWCTLFMSHIFSCCNVFMLYLLCTLFMLHHFPCCTPFMLQFLSLALFSCCIFFIMHSPMAIF